VLKISTFAKRDFCNCLFYKETQRWHKTCIRLALKRAAENQQLYFLLNYQSVFITKVQDGTKLGQRP